MTWWDLFQCCVAPHNSDLFGQCNYPSLATGERPSDQLAHWLGYLVNIQTKRRPLLAITGQPDLAMNHGGAVYGTRPVMTDREIRDSQEPDLADSWSSVKLNLARGEFCWHHKNRRQTGAKMVNTKSLARLKELLESSQLLWPGKRRFISCCKSSIISHGATSQRKTVRLRKIRG